MIVINQGRVNYSYKISEDEPIIYETICSNSVVTIIIRYNLYVEKKVDKVIASLWDIVTYTIYICNISENEVENIYMKDDIPKNEEFIKDSISINGVIKYGENPKNLFIGNLQAYKKIIVSFKVVISKCYYKCLTAAVNYGEVCYDYLYNIEELPKRMCLVTNKVTTIIKCNIFSEISKNSKVCIPINECEDIKICKMDTAIKVIEYKKINTSTGYKVLIIWKINYTINYCKYNYCNQWTMNKIKAFQYFSDIISVPDGIKYINDIFIDISEEDCSYNFFKNTSILNIYNTILVYLH